MVMVKGGDGEGERGGDGVEICSHFYPPVDHGTVYGCGWSCDVRAGGDGEEQRDGEGAEICDHFYLSVDPWYSLWSRTAL